MASGSPRSIPSTLLDPQRRVELPIGDDREAIVESGDLAASGDRR